MLFLCLILYTNTSVFFIVINFRDARFTNTIDHAVIESYVALPDYESTLHGDNVAIGSASSNASKSTRKLHGMLMYFFRDRGVRTGLTRSIVDATVAIL